MSKRAALVLAVIVVAGCDEQHAAAPVCRAPDLAASPSATPYAAARDAAEHCVKQAAFALTAAGEAAANVPAEALSRCGPREAALLKSLAEGGRISVFQQRQTRADLMHLASLTAIQARSIGCGRRPGEGPETLLTSDTPS